jgi:hypothetical protein
MYKKFKTNYMKRDDEIKDIPMLDASDEDFSAKLEFELWSTQSNSDYRNDRERPYNGQPWTDDGARGKTEVKGLTMRDMKDCLIKAFLLSGATKEYLQVEEFSKCWDFSNCKSDQDRPVPTQYLLDNQDKYVFTKVETGNWRPQDLYKLDLNEIDPIAVCQNLTCEIERMMGIFPNINTDDNSIQLPK